MRDDDSLFSGKAFGFADFKKAFDFRTHAVFLRTDPRNELGVSCIASSLRVTSRSSNKTLLFMGRTIEKFPFVRQGKRNHNICGSMLDWSSEVLQEYGLE
jgi:hypothetical protein